MENNDNKVEMSEIKVEGICKAENKPTGLNEAVEYGAGADVDPMDKFASEDNNEASPAPIEIDDNEVTTPIEPPVIDEEKIRTDPMPTESDKPAFNPNEVQSPLKNAAVEGGIMKNKSTGPTMSEPKKPADGEMIKPKPDMTKESLINKYEVSGFEVEYDSGKNMRSVAIRDYFDDLDTAFASVNSDKYLMPMPNGGYKVATIRVGAPTISYNERQVYNYKESGWVRT